MSSKYAVNLTDKQLHCVTQQIWERLQPRVDTRCHQLVSTVEQRLKAAQTSLGMTLTDEMAQMSKRLGQLTQALRNVSLETPNFTPRPDDLQASDVKSRIETIKKNSPIRDFLDQI